MTIPGVSLIDVSTYLPGEPIGAGYYTHFAGPDDLRDNPMFRAPDFPSPADDQSRVISYRFFQMIEIDVFPLAVKQNFRVQVVPIHHALTEKDMLNRVIDIVAYLAGPLDELHVMDASDALAAAADLLRA